MSTEEEDPLSQELEDEVQSRLAGFRDESNQFETSDLVQAFTATLANPIVQLLLELDLLLDPMMALVPSTVEPILGSLRRPGPSKKL